MSGPQTNPEWAREKQITAQFGLTKMILFTLRKAGKIRTVSLRAEGAQYGARLYNVASIREFIAEREAAENATTAGGKEAA